MGLDDLLGAMMKDQDEGQGSASGNAGEDPLADMLQGLVGGGATPQQGGGLEGLLGTLMGGAAGSGAGMSGAAGTGGGLMDILGSVLGGGAGGQAQSSSSIVEGVSGQTGLSQMIVQMIITFVMGKLMSGLTGQAGALPSDQGSVFPGAQSANAGLDLSGLLQQIGQTGETPSDPGAAFPGAQSSSAGLDLSGLLQQMGQDRGMAVELAQKTGLDPDTAQQSLQQVLDALSAQSRR